MKKIAIIALLVGIGCCKMYGQGGRIVTASMRSERLGAEKEYAVYLPAGYDTSDRSYPVLYLLHGATSNYRSWIEQGDLKAIADRAIRSGMAVPMIIVLPDAGGDPERNYAGKNMGYFDMPGWPYEEFFFSEFMPRVESAWRIRAEKGGRAICGLSMGGGGTAAYAQHHPELFGSACPLSGLLTERVAGSKPHFDADFFPASAANNPVQFIRNATPEQLAGLRTVRWYVDCGDDDSLYDMNVEFYLEMRRNNVPLEYRMRDGGHNWAYWQSALPAVLGFVSTGFTQ